MPQTTFRHKHTLTRNQPHDVATLKRRTILIIIVTMLARTTASRAMVRLGQNLRSMSTVPRMHKAKDAWPQLLEQTRPHGHHPHVSWNKVFQSFLYNYYFCIPCSPYCTMFTQLVFELPYNPIVTTSMIIGVVALGAGSMFFGVAHQQYKQGYWKK